LRRRSRRRDCGWSAASARVPRIRARGMRPIRSTPRARRRSRHYADLCRCNTLDKSGPPGGGCIGHACSSALFDLRYMAGSNARRSVAGSSIAWKVVVLATLFSTLSGPGNASYLITSFLMLTHEEPVARIRNTRADGPMLNIAISPPSEPADTAPLKCLAATALQASGQYWTLS